MIVSFCSVVFDPDGHVRMAADPDSNVNTVSRRVSRVATLDGNSEIIDNGYTAADAELSIRARLSERQRDRMVRLVKLHSRVTLATDAGVFEGVVDQVIFDSTSGTHESRFLVARQISE